MGTKEKIALGSKVKWKGSVSGIWFKGWLFKYTKVQIPGGQIRDSAWVCMKKGLLTALKPDVESNDWQLIKPDKLIEVK